MRLKSIRRQLIVLLGAAAVIAPALAQPKCEDPRVLKAVHKVLQVLLVQL